MDESDKFPFDLDEIRSRVIKKKASQQDAELVISTAIQDLKAWKSIYAECVQQRTFEISQLIQRNNFFMIFQGVLFAGICQSAGAIPIVTFIICLVGAASGLFQASMAAGAKYWQEHWEAGTREAELEMMKWLVVHRIIRNQINKRRLVISASLLDGLEVRRMLAHLFEDNNRIDAIRSGLWRSRPRAYVTNWMIMYRFSASRIPIYVGLLFAFFWIVLLACSIRVDWLDWHVFDFIVGFPKAST